MDGHGRTGAGGTVTEPARPADAVLRNALATALAGVGIDSPIVAVRRSENVYESTNVSEVVHCRLKRGTLPPLLCKCGPGEERDFFGLRHGVGYEAAVYRRILRDRYPAPRYYGSFADEEAGVHWLFAEYLGDGWQLDLGPDTAIIDAAAMMGELHRRAARTMASEDRAVLNRFDRGYYAACLRRASAVADGWRRRVPAFDRLTGRFADGIPLLLRAPQTLVHGEFTPHNVVWAHERPYLVDWEQAAIGPGEIDLAALTDDWEPELAEPAIEAYRRGRWPRRPRQDFAAVLEAARLCWLLRWLGDPEEAGSEEEIAWLAERANQVAAQPARRGRSG